MRVEGRIIDVHSREIFEGSVEFHEGKITAIFRHKTNEQHYIMPGFVDAHVHIESSMLTPADFGDLTVSHGTVAVVSDPHEIANVAGIQGIEFMLEDAKSSPIKTFFSIPSCVPATSFDVSGAEITAANVEQLAKSGRFIALSEMMDIEGVILNKEGVKLKLDVAKKYKLPIDGHAPLVTGEALETYVNAGISTDHECSSLDEALEKIKLGVKILIREGSAARNYQSLKSLLKSHTNQVMLCTDDSHPEEIIEKGHIDKIVRAAIKDGFDLFDVLTTSSLNAISHYSLDVGTLRVNDSADFIVVDNLTDFKVLKNYISGELKYEIGKAKPQRTKPQIINNFNHKRIDISDLKRAVSGEIKVIGLIENELITTAESYSPKVPLKNLESDMIGGINKIIYMNRFKNTPAVVEYCKGFSLSEGAVGSCISHDSHNIIAIGANDKDLTLVINELIRNKGGLALANNGEISSLELPIAGIMSDLSGAEVAEKYMALQEKVSKMGCSCKAPFMTLSFLSLIVIPEVKISENSLFFFNLRPEPSPQ